MDAAIQRGKAKSQKQGDPSLISLQIENHDLAEALWYAGDLYQLRGCQPPPPIMARRASLGSPRKHVE